MSRRPFQRLLFHGNGRGVVINDRPFDAGDLVSLDVFVQGFHGASDERVRFFLSVLPLCQLNK